MLCATCRSKVRSDTTASRVRMSWRSTNRNSSPNERPTLFNAAQLRSRLYALPRTFWPTKRLASVFDFAVSSNRRAVFMLVAASLIAFLPGVFQIPPIDRDEPHFAQKAKQMIETGDYVDLRFQGEAHYTKPVGMYWLQAAVVKTAEAFGVPDARLTIWLYRLPSLFGAAGAVLATYWCALAFVDRRCSAPKPGSPEPMPCCFLQWSPRCRCSRAHIYSRATTRSRDPDGRCLRYFGPHSRPEFW